MDDNKRGMFICHKYIKDELAWVYGFLVRTDGWHNGWGQQIGAFPDLSAHLGLWASLNLFCTLFIACHLLYF